MSIQQEIEALEDQLAKGYEVYNSSYDEFNVSKEHVSIYDVGGNLAGVIVDAVIVRKYLADIEEK